MEGKTEDGAVTTTDALKTLNTEIMADNGPDVLILDGIPAATYMERGLLADISGIVEEAGLLKNIQDAYETEEGSIYQIPARFAMPVLFGTEENLSEITDLSSLADIVEANQSVYTESFYPSAACATPQYLLHMLFETSAPAWIKEDGQLQEEQIRAFFEDAGRIYAAGKKVHRLIFRGAALSCRRWNGICDFLRRQVWQTPRQYMRKEFSWHLEICILWTAFSSDHHRKREAADYA